MPSAKRRSASEAADASRSVPTGPGVTGGSATVPGAMVLGVMVMYAIIPVRGFGQHGLGWRPGAAGALGGAGASRCVPTGAFLRVRLCGDGVAGARDF